MIVDEPEKPVNEADVPMDEEEIEEDPLKVAFEAIELDTSSAPGSKVTEYLKLLQNERVDDIAVKVKEQSIYKYEFLDHDIFNYDNYIIVILFNSIDWHKIIQNPKVLMML